MEHYPDSKVIHRRDFASGQAMVELALVLPLLILIIMGVFDLGRAIYGYNVISNSAREGARYGIVHAHRNGNPNDLDSSGVESAARSTAVGVDSADITSVNSVCLGPPPNNCEYGSSLTVTVNYTFHPLTLFFTTLNLSGRATMTIE
jgi:Flp pilus assembly protein TadG